jgi:hypothetical protein
MRRLAWLCVVVAIGCGPSATGADDDDDDGDGGGPGTPDAPPGTPDGSNPNIPDAPPCVATEVSAEEAVRPVDIIWVIDNSGSMDEEEDRVQNNMNSFASSIAASGADYHVIVITDVSHITVPPPLGGSPQLLQVNQSIGSNNALQLTVQTYPMWQSFLRANSVKHFVVVTDDESDWSQSQFETQLAGLTAPGFPDGFKFHAIVAEDPPWDFTSHCFTLAADIGQTYIDLQNSHMGLFFSLCDSDWSPLWPALAAEVTEGLALPCVYDIPDPGMGMEIDPGAVNFIYTPSGGSPQTIPNVGDMNGCTGQGWYYDNPAAPTQIITCPATCNTLTGDPTGSVEVAFGCATVIDG